MAIYPHYSLPEKDIFKLLNSSENGLSSVAAARLRERYGSNEIKDQEDLSPWRIFLRQFANPLVAILLIAILISLFLHDYLAMGVIGTIMILNAALGFFQEYKAERAIHALKQLTSPSAKVLRNGRKVILTSAELVPGDIIFVDAGDKIPADARVLESFNLETQEGSLTGESLPVFKKAGTSPSNTPLADQHNMLFASTLVTKGRAKAIVVGTGTNTAIGSIAVSMADVTPEYTPLQQKLRQLSKIITIVVIAVAIFLFILGVSTGRDASTMFLVSLALAVAAIPEGLPAVITLALAYGVQRMLKRNALVRNLPAVETLGSVTVICTDKTGTLTHNEMTVVKVWTQGKIYEVSGSGYNNKGNIIYQGKSASPVEVKLLLTAGSLCNDAFFSHDNKKKAFGDPTELALLVSAAKASLNLDHLHREQPRMSEIPFTSERKMMTTIHAFGRSRRAYTKGAPEVIIQRCSKILYYGKIIPFTKRLKKELIIQNNAFAEQALRVIAMAYRDFPVAKMASEKNEKDTIEEEMIFLGFQAMMDPPREGVKEAIFKCRQAGIKVMMMTGDHAATAKAIAAQLGIPGKVIIGSELKNINFEREIGNIGVFARINPEDKLAIVKALQKKGQVVAMTGDGVNDAPALKKADVGIAMGITGTDVAKEASDIILRDDNFVTIVNAVEEGRGVYDNIKKCFAFLFSGNIGEVGIIAAALVTNLPLPLTPLFILFINLITDGLPALALAADPYEPGSLQRPPRPKAEPIYAHLGGFLIMYPLLLATAGYLLFVLLSPTISLSKLQTIVLVSVVCFELLQAFACRSYRYSSFRAGLLKNKYLLGAVLLSVLITAAILYLPLLQKVFNTVPLGYMEIGALVLISLIGFGYIELHKQFSQFRRAW